jgi:hypothetical protein
VGDEGVVEDRADRVAIVVAALRLAADTDAF